MSRRSMHPRCTGTVFLVLSIVIKYSEVDLNQGTKDNLTDGTKNVKIASTIFTVYVVGQIKDDCSA